MPVSPSVVARIEGKQSAKEFLEANKGVGKKCQAFQEGFWREIAREAAAWRAEHDQACDVPARRPVMSDEDARKFEQTQIGFGKNAGRTYDECEIGYLLFLASKSEPLLAYLRSDRGQARQGE